MCFQMLITFFRGFVGKMSSYAKPTHNFSCSKKKSTVFHRTKNQVRKLCVGENFSSKLSRRRDKHLETHCM